MKIFLLVDWKNNTKFSLQNEFEKENIFIQVIDIPNYNIDDRVTKFGKFKLYFKYLKLALKAFKYSTKGDIIICWNFTVSIPVGIINRMFLFNRKIIALNIIAPVHKNKLIEKAKNKLFRFALNQEKLFITVNSFELISSYAKRINLKMENFFVLQDSSMEHYKSANFRERKSYIFSGGEARRDWLNLIKTAELTSEIEYYIIARKKDFDIGITIPKNVKLFFDIPKNEFYRLFEESTIVAIPLLDNKPAGLISLLAASNLSIPIIATDTPSVRNYIKDNFSGMLIKGGNNPTEFATLIRRLYYDFDLQKKYANNLNKFVNENFSEKKYAMKIIEIIEKF